MSPIYKRIITAVTLVAMLAMGLGAVISAASADTGPWQWSDISDKLSTTANRPVWASAFAHPYWYLTDGQELYTGGHVWKTDGSVMTDITAEVRNAGLNRVDDIVTDGQTIMFLKNVVSNTKNFEILTYKDGTWGYPAYSWQSRMDTNEAISSINGKDGTWMIVSTKGNIYRWKQNNSEFVRLTLPSLVSNNLNIGNKAMIYNVNHGSPGIYESDFSSQDYSVALNIVPVDGSGKWLLVARINQNGISDNGVYYQYDGNNFTDITNKFSANQNSPTKIASNGNQAVLIYGTYRRVSGSSLKTYDGYNVRTVVQLSDLGSYTYHDGVDSTGRLAWNGKSWIIVSNKLLFRLKDTELIYYGETRDYFVTMSGNGNGTFLLGGVVSDLGNQNPTSPLTAKLVRVDEGTGYVNNKPVVNTNGDVWAGMSVSNNNHELYHGQSSNITINSGSKNGISRVEIWLNGGIVKTCYTSNCDYTINGSSYTKGSAIAFNARAVDTKGQEAWTWLGEYYIPVDNYNNNTDNNNNYYNSDGRLSVWFDFSPAGNQMYSEDYKVIQAHANALDGLKKLEIYVNDSLKRSCSFSTVYGDQNCNYSVYSNQYTSNNQIKVYVKAYDNNGRQIQTNTQYIYRNGYWDNNNNGNYDSSVAAWFDGNVSKTTLGRNESRNITFYGNANRGLDRLELYANNNIVGTCSFNGATGDKTCSITIYGNNYSAGQTVTLKVKATDRDGYQNWSGSISFNIQDDGSNNNGNYVNSWMWFEPSDTNFADGESSTIKVQADADNGLNKIEVYANNSLIKTCNFSRAYGTQNCEVTIYANNYSSNSTISIYARATDYSGRTDVTDTMSLYRNGSNNNNTGTQVYSWMWLDPSDTNLDQNEIKTVNVGASADSGLQKIEIYADGGLKKTCTYNRAYGNQECSVAIYGNSFTANRNISIFARAYDYNGRMAQTSSQNVYVTGTNDNNNNNQTNVDGNLTITSNRDSGYTNYDQITFTANGSDTNGINKIEILVNAQVVKTCDSASTCSYTGGPYNTETVSYGANLYDNLGNRTWTGYKTIYKK